jgi:predicted secreted protein
MKLVKMYVCVERNEQGNIEVTPRGGGSKKTKEIIMKKTKKVYKVKKTKDGNKYVMINKNKVFLKDIKGRYTLRRD